PIAIGVGVVLVPMAANAAVDLPDLTPAELIELAASSEVDALSGTIEQRSELGLPDLAALGGAMGGPAGGAGDDGGAGAAASASDLDDLLSLATGTHTAKVYLDGPNARMQVLDRLAERNVYVSPDGVWIYDSAEKAATHVTVDTAALAALKAELQAAHAADASAAPLPTPEYTLEQALAAVDETTEVTVGTDARVAGRGAYELVLTPRDSETLVGEVRVAIDAETGEALAASVTARGEDSPAFSVAFTEVSFAAPDASVFAFSPPEGTAVTEHAIPVPTAAELQQLKAEHEAGTAGTDSGRPRPIVHGDGWSTVIELPAGTDGAAGMGADGLAMLDTMAQRVDGGRVLTTSLVSVLITDDGRVFLGSVSPERLLATAASGR
ncbi:LolA family protein, partial [Kitasatospora indigofera]|uniref:LolA family protein n=1 Tax=Kitasatospora indigofera TaxID=67307 RepID=UPI0036B2E271